MPVTGLTECLESLQDAWDFHQVPPPKCPQAQEGAVVAHFGTEAKRPELVIDMD
jgi:hypothetical protein